MPIQEHELQLVVEAPGGDVNLQGTDDGELMAFDAVTHTALAALDTAIAAVTAALGPKATEVTLAAVVAALAPLGTEGTLQQVLDAIEALTAPQTNALTNDELRDADVLVADDYDGSEYTEDQIGANGVLDFDLLAEGKLVVVDVDAVDPEDTDVYICRATVDGSAPSSIRGQRCRAGGPTYMPFPTQGTVVKVWAPAGVSVSVQTGTRA